MMIKVVKKITEDEAKTQLYELIDLDNYLDECKTCGLPSLLHKGNTCTQSNRADLQEECKIWQEYRSMIMHRKKGTMDKGIKNTKYNTTITN